MEAKTRDQLIPKTKHHEIVTNIKTVLQNTKFLPGEFQQGIEMILWLDSMLAQIPKPAPTEDLTEPVAPEAPAN